MTNADMLRDKISGSGLKIGFIADFMGISRQTLWKKINNKRPFNQYEIEKLCEILRLFDVTERDAIFFARNVD